MEKMYYVKLIFMACLWLSFLVKSGQIRQKLMNFHHNRLFFSKAQEICGIFFINFFYFLLWNSASIFDTFLCSQDIGELQMQSLSCPVPCWALWARRKQTRNSPCPQAAFFVVVVVQWGREDLFDNHKNVK